jgi:preprotein translocase subunit SecD
VDIRKMNFKKLFTNWRILILLFMLLVSVIALAPSPNKEGVAITNVLKDSSAALAGIASPKEGAKPMTKEVILEINNEKVVNINDYARLTADLEVGELVQIRTDRSIYRLEVLAETEPINVTRIVNISSDKNSTTGNASTILENRTFSDNETTLARDTIEIIETIDQAIGVANLGIVVTDAPTSNLRKGLDLQGGTRVLLTSAEPVSSDMISLAADSLKQRLNVYGISDVTVKIVRSGPEVVGGGTEFILVEIAGVTEQEVRTLIGSQGKFEAFVNNQSVFEGGTDITYVCRSATCSGIDPNSGCGTVTLEDGRKGIGCSTYFTVKLSQAAAEKHAVATRDLDVITDANGGRLLSQPIIFNLDDSQVNSLSIGAGLQGRATTDIQITGGGQGLTQQDAITDALNNMKQIQTVLITGGLPVKLDIVRVDTISPQLGAQFLSNAMLMAVLTLLAVILVIVISYRKLVLAIPIITIALSEIFLILGVAAFIGWNIDLAAIAGIIVAIGTGVDDQIVIADEALRKTGDYESKRWKDKLKRAFFIIMTAYFTTMVAMVPLLFAGAGLLKGFALTTMIGVTIGVFVTRPAFATIVEALLE